MSRFAPAMAAAAVLAALTGCSDSPAGAIGKPDVDETQALARALECPAATLDALDAFHLNPEGGDADAALAGTSIACELARDALCASTPAALVCGQRSPVGAYGGYYLARHTMPMLAWLRSELSSPEGDPDGALARAGFTSLLRILDLLDPGLEGCDTAPRLRTWCTVSATRRNVVISHRYTIAYFASEALRLLVECARAGERCPLDSDDAMNRRIALWFDLLAWDHALLDAGPVRNSFTRRLPVGNQVGKRLTALAGESGAGSPLLFQVEGWAMAVAANLLAVDAMLAAGEDPRIGPLTADALAVLDVLVGSGVSLLRERTSDTRVFDFEGEARAGAVFDRLLWDQHPYRRFAGVTSAERPFSIATPATGKNISVTLREGVPGPGTGIGLDAGHYRRIAWLHYTLRQTSRQLDRDWVDDETLEKLANQYAYAVYLHRCHGGDCSDSKADPGTAPPRFANYVSGVNGWYRLLPEAPCTHGVPPSGFSTQMLLSENLWWSLFNPDVAAIWQHLDAAVADRSLAAPSNGDRAPCGKGKGRRQWHWTYHDVIDGEVKGPPSYYRLGYLSMRRWAWLQREP